VLAHGQVLLGYVQAGAQHGLQPRVKGVTHPHYPDLPHEVLDFPIAVVAIRAILVQHHVVVRSIEFRLHPWGQQPVILWGWKSISALSAFLQESEVVDLMD
jgi:hypothetical protein